MALGCTHYMCVRTPRSNHPPHQKGRETNAMRCLCLPPQAPEVGGRLVGPPLVCHAHTAPAIAPWTLCHQTPCAIKRRRMHNATCNHTLRARSLRGCCRAPRWNSWAARRWTQRTMGSGSPLRGRPCTGPAAPGPGARWCASLRRGAAPKVSCLHAAPPACRPPCMSIRRPRVDGRTTGWAGSASCLHAGVPAGAHVVLS